MFIANDFQAVFDSRTHHLIEIMWSNIDIDEK